MSEIKYEDVIKYLSNNRVSQAQWEEMAKVSSELDKKLSKQEAEDLEISYMKMLDQLYKTDEDFICWCNWLKEICDYEDYNLKSISKYPKAVIDEYPDTVEEAYFLPCFTSANFYDKGNPYCYGSFIETWIYIKDSWDEYTTGNDSGERAFTAFWASNFNTCVLPEFIRDERYEEKQYEDLKTPTGKCHYFYKRKLVFDLTIWDRDKLANDYKNAIAK